LIRRILSWIDEQTEIVSMIKEFMEEPLAKGVGWPHVFGSAALFFFILQATTGIFLLFYYSPSPDHAYETVQYINRQVLFGRIVRGLHHWGASGMLLMVGLHMLQTFFWGAYKKPRQIIWVLGVGLLLLTFGLGFTGYLLPWDQKAYWATVVGTNIAGTVPVVGNLIREFIRGGEGVGALTITRFFAFHVYILPVLLASFAIFHIFQVRRKGLTPPGTRVGEEAGVEYTSFFYPHQVFKDLVVSLFFLLVCFWLAWHFGAPTETVANPADTAYRPVPEWYFLWMFQLLKYLPAKQFWEFTGAVLLPTIAVIAMLLYPYLDRNPERNPLKRPFATALAIVLLIGISALGFMAIASVPKEQRLSAIQAKGEKLFLDRRCNACHSINGGGGNAGTDLAQAKLHDAAKVEKILREPTSFNPRSIMPALGPDVKESDVKDLVAYLMTLDSNSSMPAEAQVGPRKPASHLEENWFINHKFEVLKDPAYCSTCHASSFCISCHQNRRPDSHLKGWLKIHGAVSTSRPEYCQVCHPPGNKLCSSCHSVMLHTPDWLTRHRQVPEPQQKLCSRCHAADYCASCHKGGKPASHKSPDWLHAHAQASPVGCETCHTTEFCASCHKGAKPASHNSTWLHAHSQAPTKNCQTCHTTEFCASCHKGAKPASHQKDWMTKHGKEGKSKKADCLVCHNQQFCLDCHVVEMPHPANFLEIHDKQPQASLAAGSPCFRCHKTADFCGQCHSELVPKTK